MLYLIPFCNTLHGHKEVYNKIMKTDRETTQIIPRFLNQKCGLCSGFGTLKYGTIVCPACLGRGIVVIDQQSGKIISQEDNDK